MASNRDSQDMPPVLVPPLGIATRRSTDTTAIDDPVIARSMRLIREHSCEGLTVKELLLEVRMSHTTFYERFRTSLGMAPHQAILRVRLERVKNLLKQTDLSLEQIAERTGFSHPEYMQVAFKREVGATPGRYRRTAANWK